jgi:hypothetical protein
MPLAERVTDSAPPEITAVLIVLVPDVPWATETDVGLALMEKSFVTGAMTVRLTGEVWVAEAAVPVMASG